MLEMPSPSGAEDAISKLLLDELSKLGLEARRDDVGNVISEIGDGSPKVLLCGHMDTIPGFLPVELKGHDLYGRGAVDAKSSLAAMIIAASKLARERFGGTLILAALVDEEGSGKGVKHLLKTSLDVDYGIFGEPSGVDGITIGYKGSMRVSLNCQTETGHVASSWLFKNSVEEAYKLWGEIRALHFPEERANSRFYSLTSCLTSIVSREAIGLVPSRCDITIDIRIPPQLSVARIEEGLQAIVRNYRARNPDVRVEICVEDSTEPYEADPRSALTRALSWAVRKVRCKQAVFLRKTGTGDMNLLGNALKIPIVSYGPGDSSLDHTDREFVDLRDYHDAIQILQLAIQKLEFMLRQ
jgi:LysW-gamma-L-lysine carboxypeptidase